MPSSSTPTETDGVDATGGVSSVRAGSPSRVPSQDAAGSERPRAATPSEPRRVSSASRAADRSAIWRSKAASSASRHSAALPSTPAPVSAAPIHVRCRPATNCRWLPRAVHLNSASNCRLRATQRRQPRRAPPTLARRCRAPRCAARRHRRGHARCQAPPRAPCCAMSWRATLASPRIQIVGCPAARAPPFYPPARGLVGLSRGNV